MIAHVAVECRREQAPACVAFYELIGLRRVAAPAALSERAAWLERDGRQVHLLFSDEPAVPALGHFALVAEGYEETVAALRAAGHEVEPRSEHWGSPRAHVRDPAGNRVELMAFAPGAHT